MSFMYREESVFDMVVLEAVYSDKKLTAGDIKSLDKISKIAMDIYDSGDIQDIRKGVQKLPELYEKDPESVKKACRLLIKKCDIVISDLEVLEEEFKHKGDLKGYRRSMAISNVIQLISTTIMVIIAGLLQIEPKFIASGGGLYSAFYIGKQKMIDAKDMDVYKEYSKIKNEDPLTLVTINIQNLKIIRRNLVMILNSMK